MADSQEERAPVGTGSTSWYRDIVTIAALAVVFSLDQITKALIRHNLVQGETYFKEGPVRILHTTNTGSAFGLFPDQTILLIVASIVGVSVLIIVYRHHAFKSFPLRLSLGLQAGGALGNLLDRLRMGEVTDFIELGFWPVFNVADASIVIGILIILLYFLFSGGKDKRSQATLYPEYESDPYTPDAMDSRELGIIDEWFYETPAEPETTLCPVCDTAMNEVPGGWSCSHCGVKEWIHDREPS